MELNSRKAFLIVEVSATPGPDERSGNARRYAESAVPEYWVIDVHARVVHVHREPKDGVYKTVSVHGVGTQVALEEHPHVKLPVAALLPPV